MENEIVVTSKKYSLNLLDASKGLLIAAFTSVITLIVDSLQRGNINFDWKNIGIVAATSAGAYLLKNFLTPSTIKKPNE